MLVIPPGFAQASLEFALIGDAEPIFVTFGLDVSDADGDFVGVAQRAVYAWTRTDSMMAQMSNQYSLTRSRVAIGQDGGPPVIVEQASGAVGSSNGPPLPQNTALLLRKRSGQGGREHRGRMYVPGINEQVVNAAGVVAPENVILLQASADLFFSGLTQAVVELWPPCPMVILHTSPQDDGAPAPTVVTSLVVDTRVATQRRRLRR